MRNVLKLSNEFSRLVRKYLKAELPDILKDNRAANSRYVCATQDHCDANMIMDEAWNNIFNKSSNSASQRDADLWNMAWDISKASEFRDLKKWAKEL